MVAVGTCENDRCVWSACLALGTTIGAFAGLAALTTGLSKDLFLSYSPEAHAFIEKIEEGKADMAITARAEKREYSVAPEGLFQAVCVDVVDQGMVETQYGPKHKIKIVWEIDEEDPKTGQRYRVAKSYNNSLGADIDNPKKKTALRQDLETWRGRPFTSDERQGFDVEKLISVNCQTQIVHNIVDNGTFANVQAVVPAPKNATKMRPSENYVRVKDRVTDAPDNGPAASSGDEDVPF